MLRCVLLMEEPYFIKYSGKDVLFAYKNYIKHKYGHCNSTVIIFDGYKHKLSIKTQEHKRRGGGGSANVKVARDIEVTNSCEKFLKNKNNKEGLINLLISNLSSSEVILEQSKGDADIDIVRKAISFANEGETVEVYTEDTDILVMLISHWKEDFANIYICIERKKRVEYFSIGEIAKKMEYNKI